MGLINKIFEPVKSISRKTVLACSLIPFILAGCGDSGTSDKKDKEPVNNKPNLEAQADGVINENSQFCRDVNGYDLDGDILTYYLIDSPTGTNIDPDTGEITWTPDDSQSNQWHNFIVGTSDGKLSDEKSFNVYQLFSIFLEYPEDRLNLQNYLLCDYIFLN